jgi:hypothetical protein
MRKHTQAYLNAIVEIATVCDGNMKPYRIQVFVNDKTDEGWLCLFPHDVTKRIPKLVLGIGPRYRFENGEAIRVPMFEGDVEPARAPKAIWVEDGCCG